MAHHLGVHVLGPFRVDGVDLAALRSRQARTVLKVLAVAGGAPVTTDALVEAVWPAVLPADPERDVSVLISRVRTLVGGGRVIRDDNGYRLRADSFDRHDLDALTREAALREANGDVAAARSAAEAALALVAGEVLAGDDGAEWLDPVRVATAHTVAETRAIAARCALAAGLPNEALRHGRHALEHDPYDEAALRIVMAAHVAVGRPASALADYATMRSRLSEDLGVDPSPETAALHSQVLAGTALPVVAPDRGERRLVGRQRELVQLDAAFARSRGAAVVVEIVGEVGVGKTALADGWSALARASGAHVLRARCTDDVDLALQPIADAVAALEPFEPTEAQAGTTAWPLVPGPLATSAALRLSAYRAVNEALRNLVVPGGLVVVIDDVHRADAVTLGWLDHLTRRPHEVAVLVLAARPLDAERVPATDMLTLSSLDLAATSELVGADRAEDLFRRTGGNPLFLVELAASADEVPASIREAVSDRLRRCGAAAPTLRAAAVLGRDIDLDLLANVLELPALTVLEHLDEGQRRSFLAERDGVMTFRHDVVREAIAGETSAARRTWLHRQAARLLATRDDASPLLLAHHAREGGDVQLAAAALADAADTARRRFDLDGAAALLDEAVGLHDNAGLRLRRSRLRMARADLDGADADAEAALGAGAGASALELRAWAARNRHDMESAIRLGTAGADVAEDPATLASCLLAVALAHRGLGDLAAADATMAAAVAAGPPPSVGVQAWVGVLRVHQGRASEALAALQPLIGAEDSGLTSFWVEHVLQMAAHAYGHVGRVTDALSLLDRLEMELRRRGSDVRYGGVSHTYRSWLLRNLGSPLAEEEARAGIDAKGHQEIRAQSQLDLADTLVHLGRLDEALTALDGASATVAARWFHNRWRAEQRAGVIRARLGLVGGDAAAALDAATTVAEMAQMRGDRRYATIARLVAATADARLGHYVDPAALAADLDRLPAVAAVEAWWLAADVADATGFAAARTAAAAAGRLLLTEAGPHADAFRGALDRRLG